MIIYFLLILFFFHRLWQVHVCLQLTGITFPVDKNLSRQPRTEKMSNATALVPKVYKSPSVEDMEILLPAPLPSECVLLVFVLNFVSNECVFFFLWITVRSWSLVWLRLRAATSPPITTDNGRNQQARKLKMKLCMNYSRTRGKRALRSTITHMFAKTTYY